MKASLACILAGLLFAIPLASVKADIRREQIHFEKRKSATAITSRKGVGF